MIDPRFDEVKIIVFMEALTQVYVSQSCSSQEEAKWNFILPLDTGKLRYFNSVEVELRAPFLKVGTSGTNMEIILAFAMEISIEER